MKFYYEEDSGGCLPGENRYRLYATPGDKGTEVWVTQSGDEVLIASICNDLNRMAEREKEHKMARDPILDTALSSFRLKVSCGQNPSFAECLYESLYIHYPDLHPHAWEQSADTYLPGLGTIRPCLDCGALVAGGPTRCGRCAKDVHDLRAANEADLVNFIESVLRTLAKAKSNPEDNSKMLWNCDYDLIYQWTTSSLALARELPSPGIYKEIESILSTALATLDKSKSDGSFQLLLVNNFRFVRSLILVVLRRIKDI